jgi:hypothetical protein
MRRAIALPSLATSSSPATPQRTTRTNVRTKNNMRRLLSMLPNTTRATLINSRRSNPQHKLITPHL